MLACFLLTALKIFKPELLVKIDKMLNADPPVSLNKSEYVGRQFMARREVEPGMYMI